MQDTDVNAGKSSTTKAPEIWDDVKCHHLIRATDSFIVFIDEELDVDWKATSEFDDEIKNNVRCVKVLNRAAVLEGTDRDTSNDKRTLNFKRQIGEAIVRAFEGHFDTADEMLQIAEKRLLDERQRRQDAIAEQIKVKDRWSTCRKAWTTTHYLLSIAALLFSSLAAAKTATLGLSETIAAWCSYLTVFFTAMLTFFAPDRKSNRYARAWSLLNNQITRYKADYQIQLKDVIDSYNQGESIIYETDANVK